MARLLKYVTDGGTSASRWRHLDWSLRTIDGFGTIHFTKKSKWETSNGIELGTVTGRSSSMRYKNKAHPELCAWDYLSFSDTKI